MGEVMSGLTNINSAHTAGILRRCCSRTRCCSQHPPSVCTRAKTRARETGRADGLSHVVRYDYIVVPAEGGYKSVPGLVGESGPKLELILNEHVSLVEMA